MYVFVCVRVRVRALNIFALQPFSHHVCIKDNNSFDNDYYLPSSLMDIVKEPCIICDGNGTFDVIPKSMDGEDEECFMKIDYITNIIGNRDLPSVGDCKELAEGCAVCHNRTVN